MTDESNANFCDLAFLKAISAFASKDEGEQFLKAIKAEAVEESYRPGVSATPNYQRAATKVFERLEKQSKRKQLDAYLTILKNKDWDEHLNHFTNKVRGLYTYLLADERGGPRSRSSTAGDIKGNYLINLQTFENNMEKKGQWQRFAAGASGGKDEVNIYKELYREGSVDNKNIREIATVYDNFFESERKLMNMIGGSKGNLKDYVVSNMWDINKLTQTAENRIDRGVIRARAFKEARGDITKMNQILFDKAYDRFADHMMPLLDHERVFGYGPVEKKNEILKNIYSKLVRAGDASVEEPQIESATSMGGARSFGKSISKSRGIHFKGGEEHMKANQAYGSGNLLLSTERTIRKISREKAFLNRFGPSAESLMDFKIAQVRKSMAGTPGLEKDLRRVKKIFNSLMTHSTRASDGLWGKIARNYRITKTITLLGQSFLNTFTDLPLHTLRYTEHGHTMFESTKMMMGSLKFRTTRPEDQLKAAKLLNRHADTIISATYRNYGQESHRGGMLPKIAELSFKFSGQTVWDHVNREGVSTMLGLDLGMQKGKEHAQLHKGTQDLMSHYGIDKDVWDMTRKDLDRIGPDYFLSPDAADAISDADISSWLRSRDRKVNPRNITLGRAEVKSRWMSYFVDQEDHTILHPTEADKIALYGDLDPNSGWRVAADMAMLFKWYTLGFSKKIMGRSIYGQGATSLYDAFIRGNMNRKAFFQMSVGLLGTAYLSVAAKAIANGQAPPNPLSVNTAVKVFMHANFLGIMSDVLFKDYSKYGKSALLDLAGPAAEDAGDLVKLFSQMVRLQDPRKTLEKLFVPTVPFTNLWYARLAYDHLIGFAIADYLSPGYIDRYTDNVEKEGGTWLVAPNEHTNTF